MDLGGSHREIFKVTSQMKATYKLTGGQELHEQFEKKLGIVKSNSLHAEKHERVRWAVAKQRNKHVVIGHRIRRSTGVSMMISLIP